VAGEGGQGALQTLSDGVATERNFDITLRGYHRREVDRYVNLLEGQVSSLTTERQEYETQLRNLTGQLHRVQMELLELRRQPAGDSKITFRHLGPRAEQILALAEDQAHALRSEAAAEIDAERATLTAERAEVQRMLLDAQRRKDKVLDDGMAELATRRTEHQKELARLKEAATDEVNRQHGLAEQVRAEADRILTAAKQEAERVTQAAAAEAERLRSEGAGQAHAIRGKAEEEAAALGSGAELYAQQVRASAEQHAQQTRVSAEQHAQQTRTAAEQAANEILVQAERHASQIRSGAEQHAARLHASAVTTADKITKEAEREAADIMTTARRSTDGLERRGSEASDRGAAGAAATRAGHRHPVASAGPSSMDKPVQPSPVDKPTQPSSVDTPVQPSSVDKSTKASPVTKSTKPSAVDKSTTVTPEATTS